MKIIKHCHPQKECSGNLEVAKGVLLGFIVYETWNRFAFCKHYIMALSMRKIINYWIRRRLRSLKISMSGYFLSLSLLESQYHYQTSIEESVVLIYEHLVNY